MRYKLIVLLVGMMTGMLFCPERTNAQSLADEIERLTLDYEKLSQMKKLLTDMKQAYSIVSKGYEDIRSIAQGNFSLHRVFLDALLAVSPVVRDYAKVKDIIDEEAALVREYKTARGYFSASGRFRIEELDYFSKLYANLLQGSVQNLEALAMIITAGQLRMSDAERLAAIDRIEGDMHGRLDFLRVFNNKVAVLAGQRGADLKNIDAMRSLYGAGQ